MMKHAVWQLPDAQFKVWITILINVNHKDRDWWDGATRVTIPAGSLPLSQRTLALEAGVGRQVVRDTIRNLRATGSITTHNGTHKGQMISVINWHLYQGTDVEENPEENPEGTQGEPKGNPTGRMKECKKEKPLSVPDGFDSFWAAYPNRRQKLAGRRAWQKINPDGKLMEIILTSVEAHKNTHDWQKDGGRFVPLPASFLNGRQWEDELPLGGNGAGYVDRLKVL